LTFPTIPENLMNVGSITYFFARSKNTGWVDGRSRRSRFFL